MDLIAAFASKKNARSSEIALARWLLAQKNLDRTDSWHRQTGAPASSEFLHRFLLHVLPKGFVRTLSFFFLANRFRASRLNLRSTVAH